MLGDDVVDLADPEAAEASLHARFDARAFAPSELAALAHAGDRHGFRWALWAAKEAAYKAARRRDAAVRFHPREFVVAGETVAHASGRYRVALTRTGAALHAVARAEDAASAADAGFGLVAPGEAPGAAARRLAVRAAARLLGCDPAELAIASDARLPGLLRAGAPCGGVLSLSHHGRFAAFALALGGARA